MADFSGMTLDPAVLASLQNTLTPAGVLSAFQAEQERQARLAAQRTSQATEAAASAGQQYQTAAAAPPPQLDPLSASLPLLLGNISSIIGGDQRAPERAQMGIAEQRRSLMQARTDNLIALKDNFDKKARAAESAGDMEAAIQARSKVETLAKTLDVLQQQEQHKQATELEGKRQQGAQDLEKLRQKGDIELEQLRGRNALSAQNAKLGGGLPGGGVAGVEAWTDLVEKGGVQIYNVPREIRTPVAVSLAAKGAAVVPPKVRETINTLSAARGILVEIGNLSKAVNTAETGKARLKTGVKSLVKGWLQSDADAALYDKTRDGFLATVSRATGERGVLTDRDVTRARLLLPNRFDTRQIAERKLKQLNAFLDGIQDRAVRIYTTPLAEPEAKAGGDPLRIR